MFEAIGLGIAAAGFVTSLFGASAQNDAQQQMLAAQQKAEAIRQKQMEDDAQRRVRAQIRQGNILHSQALATATNQGASQSSALPGAFGQVSQETSWNVAGVNTAVNYGRQMFGANQELLQAKANYVDAQQTSQIGSSLMSLGGGMVTQGNTITNIFKTGFTPLTSNT